MKKSVFCIYLLNINRSKTGRFLGSLSKMTQYILTYQHFKENHVLLRTLKKITFCHISEYVNTSRKRAFTGENFENNVFCHYILKYQQFEENSSNRLSKILPIFLKISTFQEHQILLRTLQKIAFCHVSEYINFSRKRMFS